MRLGRWELVEVVGRGATGEVWRARDDGGGAAAVKLVRGPAAAILDEARALGQLRHPHVVHVLDLGRLPSGGPGAPGQPYLVLEWADRTVAQAPIRTWDDAREVLAAVLDALAHAHARDIVHRDVKPSNVLLVRDDAARAPRVALSDFGIAALPGGGDARPAGTPAFMAPEQFLGVGVGPASDLYAVGVLAWWLVSGRTPWEGDTAQLRAAHLRAAPPALAPRLPTPDGFDRWVRVLLRKPAAERYRCAAHAREALDALGGAAGGTSFARPGLVAPTYDTLVDAPLPAPSEAPRGASAARPGRPPLPEWRADPPASRPLAAGAGVAHLRACPPIGHLDLRRRLWDALREVASSGETRRVALRGPSGIGRTHLLTWIAQRAREAGAAEALVARHDPGLGARGGLAGALAWRLGIGPLEGEAAEAHLEAALPGLPAADRPALVAILGGRDRLPDDRRRAVWRRALAALADGGPLVLAVDDAAWAAETLALLDDLPAPTLVVLGWRSDLPGVGEPPADVCLEVPPLGEAEVGALIRSLLPLDDALCARVEARAGGWPVLAVELVRDWARRGALRDLPGGYAVSDNLDAPGPMRALWAARVEEALADASDDERLAAEQAAVLGATVDAREWALACGLPASALEGARDRLVRGGLATGDAAGLAFRAPMAVEALVASARAAGRLAGLHGAAAGVVSDPQRVGAHLLEAGRHAEAADALLAGALEASRLARYPAQLAMLDAAERAIEAAGGAASGRSRLAALRSHALIQRGAIDEARGWAERAEALATCPRERGEALRRRAAVAARVGALAEAVQHQEGAVAALDAVGPLAAAVPRSELAGYYARAGRHDAARQVFDGIDARELVGGDAVALGLAHAQLLRYERRFAEALAEVEAALGVARELDHARWVGVAENLRGELLRDLGRDEESPAAYAEAVAAFDACGSRDAAIVRLNLATALARARRWADALDAIEPALRELRRSGRAPLVGGALAVRLWCTAGAGLFTTWDDDHHECAAILDRTRFCDPDVARAAEGAARACLERGDRARAAAAAALAVDQLTRLGRTEAAEACRRALLA